MLHNVTTDVEFSFNGGLYKQVDGVAMGSQLGPVLANIFVGYGETKIPSDQWPLFYRRFVDDTFSIFPNELDAANFFRLLNEVIMGISDFHNGVRIPRPTTIHGRWNPTNR